MKLENLKQPPFNTTLMGVIKGVADYYGLEASTPMLYGGSGHAFLINIHEQICPSGPYVWKYDFFYELLKNMGLEMADLGFFHKGSSLAERAAVEAKLKAALDQGLPCSLTNMEHQIITGYDDAQLSTARPWECNSEFTPATLAFGSWKEIGDEVHVNFFVFRKLPAQDDGTVIRASLRQAVELFRNPRRFSEEHYGIGPEAYDNWIKATPSDQFHGNWWDATVWSECRARAADYFEEIADKVPAAAEKAHELSKGYKEIADLLAKAGNKELPAADKVRILGELKQRELSAIDRIEGLLNGRVLG